jgi:RNA polymerase sigma factor (sigma-70 family)
MPNHDPDLDLVRALQAGDESALSQLIARHQEPLFRFICRSMANEADSHEILQDTFVRVYTKIQTFQPTARFVTWLYKIAFNLCRDQARSRRWRERGQTDSLDEAREGEESLGSQIPGQTLSAWEELCEQELKERLRVAISQLSEDLRVAFVLAVLETKSHSECAEILGTTAKTIEMRVYRARKILLEAMSED